MSPNHHMKIINQVYDAICIVTIIAMVIRKNWTLHIVYKDLIHLITGSSHTGNPLRLRLDHECRAKIQLVNPETPRHSETGPKVGNRVKI